MKLQQKTNSFTDIELDITLVHNVASVNLEEGLQRTENWHEERRGNWTASQFKNLMASSSSGGKMDWFNSEKVFKFSEGSIKYIFANAMERKTGRYLTFGTTKEMEYGTKIEPLIFKRADQELRKKGLHLKLVGFKTFPNIPTAGVSSDAVVLDELGNEVASFESKACASWTTLYDRTYERTNETSTDFWQTQGQMLAWNVEENYYCVISPPKDIKKYLYCENINDMYDEWVSETEMHIEIIKKSPIHLKALEKRIIISEATVKRFLQEPETEKSLKELLYEEIDFFKNEWKENQEAAVVGGFENITITDETKAQQQEPSLVLSEESLEPSLDLSASQDDYEKMILQHQKEEDLLEKSYEVIDSDFDDPMEKASEADKLERFEEDFDNEEIDMNNLPF